MPKNILSHTLSHVKKDEEKHGWEKVIADTEAKLRSVKQHEAALKASIRLFHKKLAAGEPLPEGLVSSTQI
jgi:hypothetical protein